MLNKKILLASGIIFFLFVYFVVSITINESFNRRIFGLETQVELIDKRRDYYFTQGITLTTVKTNLEKDKAQQRELALQLQKLNEENQKLLLQQQEQQRLAEQARLFELQKQQEAAAKISTPRVTRAS